MKVFEIRGGFGLENLKMGEKPVPAPGPGQVLVRVKACSLNYRDLMTVQGGYNPRQPLPLVPSSDGAGEVEAVGAGVTRVKAGDRVAGIFAQGWLSGPPSPEARKSTLGGPLDGMLSEYALLGEEGVVRIPGHLGMEEASTLPCAALTAWNALFGGHPLKPGETVLALGTGGVSVFALQFATMAGARTIITSGSDEKLERAKALGAWAGINYRSTPDWDKRVLELTGGQGADHVVEVGGAGTFARSLKAVRVGGRIAMIGVLSGAASEVPVTLILMKGVTVQGIFVGSRADFEAMNRAVELGGLKPAVDRVFPFGEAPAAFQLMKEGGHFGKIVVKVGD